MWAHGRYFFVISPATVERHVKKTQNMCFFKWNSSQVIWDQILAALAIGWHVLTREGRFATAIVTSDANNLRRSSVKSISPLADALQLLREHTVMLSRFVGAAPAPQRTSWWNKVLGRRDFGPIPIPCQETQGVRRKHTHNRSRQKKLMGTRVI